MNDFFSLAAISMVPLLLLMDSIALICMRFFFGWVIVEVNGSEKITLPEEERDSGFSIISCDGSHRILVPKISGLLPIFRPKSVVEVSSKIYVRKNVSVVCLSFFYDLALRILVGSLIFYGVAFFVNFEARIIFGVIMAAFPFAIFSWGLIFLVRRLRWQERLLKFKA